MIGTNCTVKKDQGFHKTCSFQFIDIRQIILFYAVTSDNDYFRDESIGLLKATSNTTQLC